MKNYVRKLIPLVTLLICGVLVQGQEATPERSAIKTPDGYLFVHNGADKSFTIEVKGKTVTANSAGENASFTVDGNLIQILLVVNENFLNGATNISDDKMLELHQKWETDYLRDEMFHKSFDVTAEQLSIGERKVRFWTLKRPMFTDSFDRDCYLTTIVGKGLLGLSMALAPGDSLAERKKFMIDTLATLKVSEKPIDVLRLAEQIRGNAKR